MCRKENSGIFNFAQFFFHWLSRPYVYLSCQAVFACRIHSFFIRDSDDNACVFEQHIFIYVWWLPVCWFREIFLSYHSDLISRWNQSWLIPDNQLLLIRRRINIFCLLELNWHLDRKQKNKNYIFIINILIFCIHLF